MFKTSYPITREYIREASAAASLKCSPRIFFGSAAASAAFDSRTICVSLSLLDEDFTPPASNSKFLLEK